MARLATIDPDGRPNLVPVVFALVGEELYTAVDRKPKSSGRLARVANIERDARVTVLIDGYQEDWSRLWWVRIRGRARVLDAGPALDRALGALVGRYPQYAEAPPPGPVLAVDIEDWREWSAVQ